MWIRSTLFCVLLAIIAPAFAAYSEQWMSNADIAKAAGHPAATSKKTSARHATATQHVDDDPIAAFAHPRTSSKPSK
ncbi:hypothetical protein [Caballeronia sp. BR00000012568055]|uniref:hypothetical protein n=1 Tax=Caballeronia sp. BR00000012568055 TaxID=2918761 RepID=UPI0023F63467|nr:hypothetical protein [Caballeronia sp. BR00000012568055]